MRIKTRIDEYNVENMEAVEATVRSLTQHCTRLEELGYELKHGIERARSDGFQDVNCDKAENEIDEYCRNLNNARDEFEELATSVRAFVDKIHDIWNSWGR